MDKNDGLTSTLIEVLNDGDERINQMKTPEFLLCAGLLPFVTFCPAVHATIYPNPLASRTQVMAGTTTTASTFEIRLGSGFGFGISSPIFDTLTLSASDVGQTFPITQAQDADFNSLVALLQNGQSNPLELDLSFNQFASIAYGLSTSKSSFFAPLPAGNNGIDFQGFPIDNIALRVDSVNISAGNFSIQATIFVDSAPVPEPSAGALASLGGFLAVFLARRKFR